MKLKGTLALALSLSITIGLLPFKTETTFADETSIVVDKQGDNSNGSVTIGNDYMSRKFKIKDGHLSTETIINKRTNEGETVFTPGEGSQEFTLGSDADDSESEPPFDYPDGIDRSGWAYACNSVSPNEGSLAALFDGDPKTYWHSDYSNTAGQVAPRNYPFIVTIDLGESKTLTGFSYLPRHHGVNTNGVVKAYEIYVSNEPKDINDMSADWGEPVLVGKIGYGTNVETKYANFESPVTGKYVKFNITSSVNGFGSGAEFNLYDKPVQSNMDVSSQVDFLKSSDLELSNIAVEDTTATINNIQKRGKKVTFSFKLYLAKEVNWSIDMVVVMYEGDHFMRKFIEISADNKDKSTIAYIDLDVFKLSSTDTKWSRPDNMKNGWLSSEMMALGQPIYIDGMFFGCEFPAADSYIDQNTSHIRYFSGKNFARLEADNQLTTDGKYVTWQTVAGAARSTDDSVIQSDFYEYIKSIATPTDFRKQYNSWYENMLGISEENAIKAFYKMEKGLTQSGVEPLDSYVMDDGWNNYNEYEGQHSSSYDIANTGVSANKTGFWEFNDKFPDELYPLSNVARKFNSDFGLWLGPRGGYNYPGDFANMLVNRETGGKNPASGDICIAHPSYTQKIEDLFIDYQNRFGVNYWKLDGFLLKPCTDTTHGHMVGGPNGMYAITDTWEKWIDVFEAMRENKPDIWINATCYVNPSPWFLQWVNSVWIQATLDMGGLDTGIGEGMLDRALTYRDYEYFKLVKTNELQFPLANYYNHDPIYATTAQVNSPMTDDEFRTYLYMMATRGTAFWELYFTPEYIDDGDKWLITSEFLKWTEENFHILRNAKLIGNPPTNVVEGANGTATGSIYGYSCWDGSEGIVSIRNSKNETQTLDITLDRNIGVGEGANNLYRSTILNHKGSEDNNSQTFNYGDTISVTLQSGEAKIWSFTSVQDTVKPTVKSVKTTSANTVDVVFDKAVNHDLDKSSFTVANNNVASIRVKGDYKAVELSLETVLEKDTPYALSITGVQDAEKRNTIDDITKEFTYFKDNIIQHIVNKDNLNNSESIETVADSQLNGYIMYIKNNGYTAKNTNSVSGNEDFNISLVVKTDVSDATIVSQGDPNTNGYSLSVKGGKAAFKVNGLEVISEKEINTNKNIFISGTKEKNGIVKIYIDGQLDKSNYDKNNINGDISANPITVGSSSFKGYLADIWIFNKALAFDEQIVKVGELPKPDDPNKDPYEYSIKDLGIEAIQSDGNPVKSHAGNEIDKAVDGDNTTTWHSLWQPPYDPYEDLAYPIDVTLDTKSMHKLDKVEYRTSGGNGCITDLDILYSADGTNWTTAAKDIKWANDSNTKVYTFSNQPEARYVQLKVKDSVGTTVDNQPIQFISALEFRVYQVPPTTSNDLQQVIDNSKIVVDDKNATLNTVIKSIKDLSDAIVDYNKSQPNK